MKIQDHLIQDYPTANPYQATQTFKKQLLKGEAIVVKEEAGFTGLLTLNDIVTKPHNLVIDCLVPKPTLQTTDECFPTLLFMCQNNYDFLPAMEGNEFRGVVSRKKLFIDFLEEPEEKNQCSLKEQVIKLENELLTKNKFLAVIGHDVKNLFTQVMGSLEMLDHRLEQIQDSKSKAIIQLTRRSAEQVNNTFEGMLLWARLSTGQLPFQPQELELNIHLDRVVNKFQLAGNVKNITIKNTLDQPVKINADANMLDCILLNLVYNAIKYTPSGGEIWLAAEQDQDKTEIIVVDSGTGMTLQQQKLLFTPGTQPKPGTSHEIGSGIGLIICQEFVEKHNGKIEIESEQNKGTRVIITLPNSILQREEMLLSPLHRDQ